MPWMKVFWRVGLKTGSSKFEFHLSLNKNFTNSYFYFSRYVSLVNPKVQPSKEDLDVLKEPLKEIVDELFTSDQHRTKQ